MTTMKVSDFSIMTSCWQEGCHSNMNLRVTGQRGSWGCQRHAGKRRRWWWRWCRKCLPVGATVSLLALLAALNTKNFITVAFIWIKLYWQAAVTLLTDVGRIWMKLYWNQQSEHCGHCESNKTSNNWSILWLWQSGVLTNRKAELSSCGRSHGAEIRPNWPITDQTGSNYEHEEFTNWLQNSRVSTFIRFMWRLCH